MKQQEIFREAIIVFGESAQLGMLIEESAETIQAVNKLFRNWDSESKRKFYLNNLAQELADLEIMIEQAKLMFKEYDFQNKVLLHKHKKIEKLKKIIINTR